MRYTLLILIFLPAFTFAQSAKKLYKNANAAFEKKNYNEAVSLYTAAISTGPAKKEMYQKRAEAYEKVKDWNNAANDQLAFLKLSPSTQAVYIKAFDNLIKSDRLKEAAEVNEKLYKLNKKKPEAVYQQIELAIFNKDFGKAFEVAEKWVRSHKTDHQGLYWKAAAADSLKRTSIAIEAYEKALQEVKSELKSKKGQIPVYQKYFIGLAIAQVHMGRYDDALASFEKGYNSDKDDIEMPFNKDFYYLRSQAYFGKLDFINTISDLEKAIALDNKNTFYFATRAGVNKKAGQYLNAVNDYSKCIVIDEKNALYYGERAQCYTELGMLTDAIADFKQSLALNPNQPALQELYNQVNKKDYEKNREAEVPVVRVIKPVADRKGFINVTIGQLQVKFDMEVRDASPIKYIRFNGKDAEFDKKNKNPFLYHLADIEGVDEIVLTVADIYNNETTVKYKIGRLIPNIQNTMDIKGILKGGANMELILQNTAISVYNQDGEKMAKTITNDKGYFKFSRLPSDEIYVLKIDDKSINGEPFIKVGIYNEEGQQVLVADANGNIFSFELLPYAGNNMSLMSVEDVAIKIDIKGKLIADNQRKEPIYNQKVKLLDREGKVVSVCISDSTGFFAFKNLPTGKAYFIHIDTLNSNFLSLRNIIITDEKGNVVQQIVADKQLKFQYEYLPMQNFSLASISEFDPWENMTDLLKTKSKYEIIENIYYNLGAWNVTLGAELVLEKALDMMLKHKTLHLEIHSHTDSQASDAFNNELSNKRAQACVDYLIAKGVDASRLKAVGFGETQLINRCKNDVDCSDEEHKQNRRTVFVINEVK